jgi:hypothetical protein
VNSGWQPWTPAGEPDLRIRPAWYWRTFLPFGLVACVLGLTATDDGGDRIVWGLLAAVFLYAVLGSWTTVIEITGKALVRRRFGISTRRISLDALKYADLEHSRNGWWLDFKDQSGAEVSTWRNSWRPADWERLYAAVMAGAPPRRTLKERIGNPVKATSRFLLIWLVAIAVYGLSNVGWKVGRIVEVLPELGAVSALQLFVGASYWALAAHFEKKNEDTPYPRSWDDRFFTRFRWWFH